MDHSCNENVYIHRVSTEIFDTKRMGIHHNVLYFSSTLIPPLYVKNRVGVTVVTFNEKILTLIETIFVGGCKSCNGTLLKKVFGILWGRNKTSKYRKITDESKLQHFENVTGDDKRLDVLVPQVFILWLK